MDSNTDNDFIEYESNIENGSFESELDEESPISWLSKIMSQNFYIILLNATTHLEVGFYI